MSGFEPGEGWREMPHLGDQELPKDCVAYLQPEGGWRYWVREDPLLLPDEPYTVIRLRWKAAFGGNSVVVRHANGEWTWVNTAAQGPIDASHVESFEVLAEPRAVTAKAVLDRVLHLSDTGSYADEAVHQVRGEFGVDQ